MKLNMIWRIMQTLGAYLWNDFDQDLWSEITRIMIYQSTWLVQLQTKKIKDFSRTVQGQMTCTEDEPKCFLGKIILFHMKRCGVNKVVDFKDFSRTLTEFKTFSRLYETAPPPRSPPQLIWRSGSATGFVGSFHEPWSEWSRITDPDPDHPKGTHP